MTYTGKMIDNLQAIADSFRPNHCPTCGSVNRNEKWCVACCQGFGVHTTKHGPQCSDAWHPEVPASCQLEIPRANGGPESCFSDRCGRSTLTCCADCGTAICEKHSVTVQHQGTAYVKCSVCAEPDKEEMLDVLSDCADVISPKFYPSLMDRIEDVLKRSGRLA